MTNQCCSSWAKAQTPGTDNEGHGALIGLFGDRYYIGDAVELPPVKLCPWCGADKTSPVEPEKP